MLTASHLAVAVASSLLTLLVAPASLSFDHARGPLVRGASNAQLEHQLGADPPLPDARVPEIKRDHARLGEGHDPEAGKAQTTEAVPPARDHHTSAPTSDGFGLFVFGGRTAESMDHAALNDLWRYSIATKSWKQLHPQGILPTVSNNHKPFFTFLSFYISHL